MQSQPKIFDSPPAPKIWDLFIEAGARWSRDDATRMSAALAYYAIFSLAPLLILVITIAGLAFGKDAAQGRLFTELRGLIGSQGAEAIQAMIRAAWRPAQGLMASALGLLTLMFGALGVLLELKSALNKIWRAPAMSGWRVLITSRVQSLGLILGVGFLLLVSLIISATIAAVGEFVNHLMPVSESWLQSVQVLVSIVIITGLFAMIFKWLPDTRVHWRDVWIGSALTSVLFNFGKLAIGLYLGKSGVMSTYGAAGSVVILLLWVYYSSMILYYGAEFTAVTAERFGSRKLFTVV